jgi:elongation factor G
MPQNGRKFRRQKEGNQMKYASNNIRNILVAGHAGCGKTTLTEALLYIAGKLERMGRVEDGTTVSDFDPEEAKRHASLSASVVPVEYDGIKYNLIDAPGLFDFEAGEYEGVQAAESVLLCVSGRSGVSVGAEKAFHLARKNGKATMIFVTKTDLENADFFKILEDMKIKFGTSVCPCVVPARMDDGTVCYINLFSQKAFTYENGKQVQVDLPDIGHRFQGLIEAMSEAIAETDDALMEKFFGGEPFTTDEIVEGMRKGVKDGKITPVLCGSAVNLQALDMLLFNMRKLLPSPAHNEEGMAATDAKGEPVMLHCSETEPTAAFVFKTVADPFVGKLSYFRVISGKLTAGLSLINARTGEAEKLGKPLSVCGKKQTETAEIGAGDIGAVAKLVTAKTGDTLCDAARVAALPQPAFPKPSLFMAVTVSKKGDEGKIGSALARLMEEDPTLVYLTNKETKQQIIGGLGEQHLDVIVAELKSKFGVEVGLAAPRIAYRESIRKACQKQGRHKKQTGGHGQFGDVVINFEPVEGDDVVFEEKVFGGSVPKNYFPAVEKGVRLAAEKGVLAGYPVVGLKATLLDGSYHPVDSSEMAFIQAAKLAYKAALPEAEPVILEPIHTLKAHVPAENTGDVMGDVTKRRGRVLGMEPDDDGMQTVVAEVPLSEMQNFTTVIRQMTQGRGWFGTEFARYEIVPANLVPAIVEQSKKLGNMTEDSDE